MSNSSINVTEGSGKRLNTWDRTISSVLVQDQFTLPGEYPYPTYEVHSSGTTSVATTGDHAFQLMAGSALLVRVRRIRVWQFNHAQTASMLTLIVKRLSTAGSGGSTETPRPWDTRDAAAGATCQRLPTVKGTEGVELYRIGMALRTGFSGNPELPWEWTQLPGTEPLIIPAGTANGICARVDSGVTNATVMWSIEFVETSF